MSETLAEFSERKAEEDKIQKPIIFLDIDGVLNSIDLTLMARSLERQPKHLLHDIDPVRVGILKWIVDHTGAEIVISSTWRMGRTPEWFIGFFEALNWPMPPIVNCTPELPGIRGEEIRAYLDERWFESDRPPYVILDDDSDFHPDQSFVHVDRIAGLSLKHAIACVDILGLKDEEDRDAIEGLRGHATFIRKSALGVVDITRNK